MPSNPRPPAAIAAHFDAVRPSPRDAAHYKRIGLLPSGDELYILVDPAWPPAVQIAAGRARRLILSRIFLMTDHIYIISVVKNILDKIKT
jgi:hypothetical protein